MKDQHIGELVGKYVVIASNGETLIWWCSTEWKEEAQLAIDEGRNFAEVKRNLQSAGFTVEEAQSSKVWLGRGD